MFSIHMTVEKFDNAIVTVHFGFVFSRKSWTGKSHDYHLATLKRKAGVFFYDGISVDVTLRFTAEMKLRFQISPAR